MRVILKPAGLILLVGIMIILSSVVYSRRKKEEIAVLPRTEAIAGFQSRKRAEGGAPPALFEGKEKVRPVDLTKAGTADWVQWGHPSAGSVNRKRATKGTRIGDVGLVRPNVGLRSEGRRGPSRGFVWSDGAPTRRTDVVYSGIFVGEGNGFRFSVPADTRTRRLRVYTGGFQAGGELYARVSDGTRPEVTMEEAALSNGYYTRAYTVTFRSAAPDGKMTVEWRMTSGSGNISLQAAALE